MNRKGAISIVDSSQKWGPGPWAPRIPNDILPLNAFNMNLFRFAVHFHVALFGFEEETAFRHLFGRDY